MIDRLIENWLDNASEKTFQKPFCYMLISEGYTILHLTRHCGMEHGKDIIAVDKDDNVCAFQLKGAPNSKIKLKHWQEELHGQILQLIHTPVSHPSAKSDKQHKSFLVTNGEIEEEVFNAINNENIAWERRGFPEKSLDTLVKGQLLSMAKELKTNFLPTNFNDVKSLLEFYLQSGEGLLPKGKLLNLLNSYLNGFNPKNKSEIKRAITNTALLCSLATSSYSNKNNHVAEVEAWVVYIACIFNALQRHKLPFTLCKNEIAIAEEIIINSLENILEEIQDPKNLIVGDRTGEGYIYNIRITWLMALVSCLGLYYSLKGIQSKIHKTIKAFIIENINRLDFWGEGVVPQFIVIYWYYCKIDATENSAQILKNLINTICFINSEKYKGLTFNSYIDIEDAFIEANNSKFEEKHKNNFKGTSYVLEGVVHLYVRENYKQTLKGMWPNICKVMNACFIYKDKADYFNWHNEEGQELISAPKQTKHWDELKSEAFDSEGINIPDVLKEQFWFFPLFIIVFPHRFNSENLRWFDSLIKRMIKTPIFY